MAKQSVQTQAVMLKVNIAKLKKQFTTDNPLINDLIYAGVSQFLGIKNGPMEIQLGGGESLAMPNVAMLQFLQDMDILVPEDVNQEKEVALHS